MKPFLLLAIRPEDVAADDEYAAMLRCTGLEEGQLRRIRTEQGPIGRIDLDQWSGIILGGGPYQVSDPEDSKSAVQRRVEAELAALLDDVVARDHPFFGSCYGIGTLGRHQGAVVDRTYGEPISGVQITVTEAGLSDPLFRVAGPSFGAYLGHKEAILKLPAHAMADPSNDQLTIYSNDMKSSNGPTISPETAPRSAARRDRSSAPRRRTS